MLNKAQKQSILKYQRKTPTFPHSYGISTTVPHVLHEIHIWLEALKCAVRTLLHDITQCNRLSIHSENGAMVNNLARVVGLLSIGLRMCLNAIIV